MTYVYVVLVKTWSGPRIEGVYREEIYALDAQRALDDALVFKVELK